MYTGFPVFYCSELESNWCYPVTMQLLIKTNLFPSEFLHCFPHTFPMSWMSLLKACFHKIKLLLHNFQSSIAQLRPCTLVYLLLTISVLHTIKYWIYHQSLASTWLSSFYIHDLSSFTFATLCLNSINHFITVPCIKLKQGSDTCGDPHSPQLWHGENADKK